MAPPRKHEAGVCIRCGESNPAEFYPSVLRRGKSAWCRTCTKAYYRERQADGRARHSGYQQKWRRNQMEWIEALRTERGCEACGEKHPACLEFHHRDTAEKEFTISQQAIRFSKERVEAEIAKCVVLCSNCHRKRHYDEQSGPFWRRLQEA